jgi:hypothetical protein
MGRNGLENRRGVEIRRGSIPPLSANIMMTILETNPKQKRRMKFIFAFVILAYLVFGSSSWLYSIQASTDTIDPVTNSEVLVAIIIKDESTPVKTTPEKPSKQNPGKQAVPERTAPIDRISNPTKIPDKITATPSKNKELPPGNYKISNRDYDPPIIDGGGNDKDGGDGNSNNNQPHQVKVDLPEPPPLPTPTATPKKEVLKQSGGVITSQAISLPKPKYPVLARNISTVVRVQVVVNEYGKVTSAKAISGNPLFFANAAGAAMGARFTPTYLSKQPVQVTGFIDYNFVP